MSVFVNLDVPVMNDTDGKSSIVRILVKFKNQEILDIHEDTGFDSMVEQLNDVIEKKLPGYRQDDLPECWNIHTEPGQFDLEINE